MKLSRGTSHKPKQFKNMVVSGTYYCTPNPWYKRMEDRVVEWKISEEI